MIDETFRVLQADFADYLGEIQIAAVEGKSEYRLETEKRGFIRVAVETPAGLPRAAWRKIAMMWLDDPAIVRPSAKKAKFCYCNGSTRGVQNKNLPLPPECGDREYDIRHRLAFGGK